MPEHNGERERERQDQRDYIRRRVKQGVDLGALLADQLLDVIEIILLWFTKHRKALALFTIFEVWIHVHGFQNLAELQSWVDAIPIIGPLIRGWFEAGAPGAK